MRHGASTEARDNDGYTPEDLAKASDPTPERIFIESITSDRELKASREGSN
jgi:hypothetical protein